MVGFDTYDFSSMGFDHDCEAPCEFSTELPVHSSAERFCRSAAVLSSGRLRLLGSCGRHSRLKRPNRPLDNSHDCSNDRPNTNHERRNFDGFQRYKRSEAVVVTCAKTLHHALPVGSTRQFV